MGASLGGDDDDVISDINVTPFVDIVLVLLIIFMVTATTIAESSIKVELPDAASGEATESQSFGITLYTDGTMRIDGDLVTTEQLRGRLRKAVAETDEVVVLIAADKAVAHGRVVWLIDLVKTEGVAKFAINIDKATSIPPDPADVGEGIGVMP